MPTASHPVRPAPSTRHGPDIAHPTLEVSMILPSDKEGHWMAIWRGRWLGTYPSDTDADGALTRLDEMDARARSLTTARISAKRAAGKAARA